MPSLLSQIERVPVDSLELYPGNPRRGNVPVISASLRENQQYAPIVVQRSTRYVLAGNHTLKAARELGWPEIDVVFVDVDDDRARRIVLSSNRTAEVGSYDNDELVQLLSYLDDDYEGTGWTEEAVNVLVHGYEELPPGGGAEPLHTADLLAGTPDSYREQYAVIVMCAGEGEQGSVFAQLSDLGFNCRVVTT